MDDIGIISKLHEWGCDTEGALERTLGDTAFYMKCIRRTVGNPGFEELAAALESGDTKGAFETAHMLKGVFANLGLNPLYKKACEIVEPLRSGSTEGVLKNYTELAILRAKLSDIIEKKAD